MLQKQLVHLNMSGGLQKKDDQFLVIPSKLAVADNVQFDDASTVVRRGGQSSVSLTPIGGFGSFTLGQVTRAFSHQGVAYLEGISASATPGGVRRVQKSGGTIPVANPSMVTNFNTPYHFRRAGMSTARIGGVTQKGSTYGGSSIPRFDGSYDCAVLGNLTCYVYETRNAALGTQSVHLTVVDEVTGFRMYDGLLTNGTEVLVKPRVVASVAQNKFFIYVASFASGGTAYTIQGMTVSSVGAVSSFSTVASASTSGTTEGAALSECLYDIVFSTDAARLGLVMRSLVDLATYSISTTDGVTATSIGAFNTSVAPESLTALITNDGSTYRIHALYSINTNVAKGMYTNMAAYAASAETTIGTAAVGTGVGRIVAYENSTTQMYVAFDSVDANGNSVLRLSSCTHTYGVLSECASTSPWFLAGRIGVMNSRLYVPMVFLSLEYQTTVYLIDLTEALGNLGVAGAVGAPPHVIARIDYGEVAISRNRLANTTRVASVPVRSSTLVIPYLKYETNLRLAGTTNDTAYALARATVDFDSQLQHEEINGVTFLAGACPHIFDGSNYVEEGFHHGPEVISVGAAAASGTYVLPNASDTFTFCFTWAWQDAQGNWWESAPSGEKSITIVAGSGNYSITPVIASPPTLKANAQLLWYRTKGDSTDTSLYLATTFAGSALISDTDLDDGEQLYTAGNVLPNTPAPSCRHVSTFQKRLVLAGCGDGSRVHWSKVTTPGYGVEFSSGDPTHQTQVPADAGRAVATAEMDDRLIILCENAVGISAGNGPNDSGTQGQYSDFATIVRETGASWDSPKSVVSASEGVWFRSPFGIRLVSRSGGLGLAPDGKQAGAEVDSLVSGNLVAVAGDAKQQTRFYQSSGTCLVWDSQWKQWTRFTGMANVDAVYADGRYYHVSNYSTTTPLMRWTDETAYTDVNDAGTSAQTFLSTIETAWLSFAGVQGFQRIYRLMLLGRNLDGEGSDSRITVTGSVYLNFNESSAADSFTTGSLAPSVNDTVQIQHHFASQKCETMKLSISWTPAGGTPGRFRLTDLTLQVGIKPGYYKLPSSQRF